MPLTFEQTLDVINQFDRLEGIGKQYLALVLYTAMRKSEALGLRWEDIHIADESASDVVGYIHVERGVTYAKDEKTGKNNISICTTKNGEARDVPLLKPLWEILRPFKSNGYLFDAGGAIRDSTTYRSEDIGP